LLPIATLFLSFWPGRSLADWRHVQRHGAPFHTGSLLNCSMFLELDCKLVEQVPAKLRVSDRSSPEQDGQLHLVSAIEEPGRLAALGLKIGLANLGLDTDFLEFGYMLVTSGITFFSTLFVSKFSVIHQPAHRWRCIRRNLNEV
jgi:hypothetical protein